MRFVILCATALALFAASADAGERRICKNGKCSVRAGGCIGGKCRLR